jgi:hypothetical protein
VSRSSASSILSMPDERFWRELEDRLLARECHQLRRLAWQVIDGRLSAIVRRFKWRAPTRSVGRRPFKPQTALLPEGRPWVRSGSWRSQTRYKSDFKRTWVRLGERGRRGRFGPRRGESVFSRENRLTTEFFLQKKRTFPRQEAERCRLDFVCL